MPSEFEAVPVQPIQSESRLEKLYNFLVFSSQDPTQISLRVKSSIGFLVPLLVLLLAQRGINVSGDQVLSSVDEVVKLISEIGMVVATISHGYAWYRAVKK